MSKQDKLRMIHDKYLPNRHFMPFRNMEHPSTFELIYGLYEYLDEHNFISYTITFLAFLIFFNPLMGLYKLISNLVNRFNRYTNAPKPVQPRDDVFYNKEDRELNIYYDQNEYYEHMVHYSLATPLSGKVQGRDNGDYDMNHRASRRYSYDQGLNFKEDYSG